MLLDSANYYTTTINVPPPTRGQIERLQAEMLPVATAVPEAAHEFEPGIYRRTLTIPADMLVVGKVHKHAHLMKVTQGRATVIDEFGRYEVSAGFEQTSRPGVKRVVFAHEDTTFVTEHLNSSGTQDLALIEAEHIEPESEESRALMASITGALS